MASTEKTVTEKTVTEKTVASTPLRINAATMRAIVQTQYGGPEVLRLEQVDRPVLNDRNLLGGNDQNSGDHLDDHKVLVRVRSAAVNSGDWRLMRGNPFLLRLIWGGILRPKIKTLGFDVAGEVEAIGRQVTQFQAGDAVFGDLSSSGFGSFAEYVCVPETAIVKKPSTVSFEQAAATSGAGLTALQGLRNCGNLQPGQRVLITGASSGVGTFAIQIAKLMGAEVTAVGHARKVDRIRSLGADVVMDYAQMDRMQSCDHYDLVLDIAAFQSIFKRLSFVKPDGTYVLVGGAISKFLQIMVLGPVLFRNYSQTVKALEVKPNAADLMMLADWLDSGAIVPAIDRYYPLEGVPDAIRDLEARQLCGKAVIQVQSFKG